MNSPEAVPALEAVVTRAAETFKETLRRYHPWLRPDSAEQRSGNTERNLSYQFAQGFRAMYGESGLVVMEVPLPSKRDVYEDHLDAYLFAPQLAVLLECKVHSGNDSLADVAADMGRMTPAMLEQIRKRHQGPDPSKAHETLAMVLVEAWGRKGSSLEWWRDELKRARKAHGKLPSDCCYGGTEIFEANPRSDGTLYWLYAYRHLDRTL